MEIVTKSAKETEHAGFILARELKSGPASKRAMVVALYGDLGSGKTTFTKGFAKGLDLKEDILSPTFVIQKDFPVSSKNFTNFYHIDAYRLKNPEELTELGFGDIAKKPKNIIVIEWADKVEKILPKEILKIDFFNLEKGRRAIIIS